MFKEFAKRYPWLNLAIIGSLLLAACRPPSTPTATLESTPTRTPIPSTPIQADVSANLVLNLPTEVPSPTSRVLTYNDFVSQMAKAGLLVTRDHGWPVSKKTLINVLAVTSNSPNAPKAPAYSYIDGVENVVVLKIWTGAKYTEYTLPIVQCGQQGYYCGLIINGNQLFDPRTIGSNPIIKLLQLPNID